MKFRIGPTAFVILVFVGTTAANGTDVSQPPLIPDACGTQYYLHLVGKPQSAIDALEIKPPMRIIEHGQIVTLEFLPNRISFWLDENGLVLRVECG